MKTHFEQLRDWMKLYENIEEEVLIQALFLLRAHYSLAGIVIICQRIFTLIGDKELPGFRDELNTLKIISTLKESPEHSHFFSGTIDRNRHTPTPLRPYTGDSGICDLLLIQAGRIESNERFDNLIIWFLEQIFHYQQKVHTLTLYSDYLNGDGRIKLKDQKGSRVYNAFLAIRLLGDPSYKDILEQVEKLLTNKELEEFINLMSAVCKDKPLVEKLLTNNEPEQLINLMSAVYKNKRLVEKLLTNKELEEFINLMSAVCKDKPLVEKLLTNNEPEQLINLMSAVYKNKRLIEKLLINNEPKEFINLMSAVYKDKPLVEKLLTNNDPELLINLMSAVYKNKRLIEKLLINNEPKQLINLMSAVCKDKRLQEVFYALKLFLSQIW